MIFYSFSYPIIFIRCFYKCILFNLRAFKITVKLLNTIAKLAIIGLIVIPNEENTPIAIGIIKLL